MEKEGKLKKHEKEKIEIPREGSPSCALNNTKLYLYSFQSQSNRSKIMRAIFASRTFIFQSLPQIYYVAMLNFGGSMLTREKSKQGVTTYAWAPG